MLSEICECKLNIHVIDNVRNDEELWTGKGNKVLK